MTYRKKLIESEDFPLQEINKWSSKEKSVSRGHPSSLHRWWAARPLAACRAVLFCSIIDDPAEHPDKFPTEEAQKKERERLFGIVKSMLPWKNLEKPQNIEAARAEIRNFCGDDLPKIFDSFAGGGAYP